MPDEQTFQYILNFKIKKGYTGDLVAKCVEFPAIMVQGKNMSNLYKKAQKALFLYANTFPEKRKEFIEKYSTPVENELEPKISFNAKESQKAWEHFPKISDKHDKWQQVELIATIK